MNNKETKEEIINYIEKASVVILGLLFILFPLLFTNLTTEFFILPKQALLIFGVIILMLLFAIKNILLEKILIRRTPFDLAVVLFIGALLVSTVFSVDRWNSLFTFIPVLFAGLSFFTIVYNAKNEKSVLVLISSLLAGGVLLSLGSLLSYFKIYVFPFDFTKFQNFTTAGSVLDQALYLLFILPVGLYFLSPFVFRKKDVESQRIKRKDLLKLAGFGSASIVILLGLIISIYSLIQPQALVVLPMQDGFQIAFAAISQDSGRIFQGLLFGTGFGQYLIDFTRFKQASFSMNPTLWSLTFVHSSSFVLELLATTGLIGLLSFFYLCYKAIREKPLFIPLIVALGVCFILPLSFFNVALIFFLLGLYSALRGLTDSQRYFDVEIQLVALKKGFFSFSLEESARVKGYNKTLSSFVFIIIFIFSVLVGFLSFDYLAANVNFQKSLIAASQNNGQLTYTYQNAAISSLSGRYVDSYSRVFSQTNLALASSLASSIPQGASPSAETTQTIYTLVQQAINSARQATTLSPQNTIDWENLSSIYRALIGFGQNADSFAILAQEQAVQLDPNNPQKYIALGGIYYQLQAWDKAREQFQKAINLKSDYPNAYYNLGHVFQEQGDLKSALTQYQLVKTLVANDPENLSKINSEIQALETQIGQQEAAQNQTSGQNAANNTPLSVPQTETTLPPQNPPVRIPGPSDSPTPSPTTTPTP